MATGLCEKRQHSPHLFVPIPGLKVVATGLCEKKQHIRAECAGPWPPWKIFSSVNIFGITYSCNRYTATITARLPVKQRHTAGQKVVQQVHSTLQSVAPAPPKEMS